MPRTERGCLDRVAASPTKPCSKEPCLGEERKSDAKHGSGEDATDTDDVVADRMGRRPSNL